MYTFDLMSKVLFLIRLARDKAYVSEPILPLLDAFLLPNYPFSRLFPHRLLLLPGSSFHSELGRPAPAGHFGRPHRIIENTREKKVP